MRIESTTPMHNGGWAHRLSEPRPFRPLPPKPKPAPAIDAAKLFAEFSAATWREMQEQLAASLGVALDALEAIGCAWAVGHRAWAFPMKDWQGKIIGLRLRDHTGHKWAVKGSRAGLFYAEGEAGMVYCCEGPTDTAAGLSIGLHCVGRPSCLGCEEETDRLLKRKKARRAVIISDNDGPGYRGAEKLKTVLSVPSVILVPPAKDLRSAVVAGLTAEVTVTMIRSLVWTQPQRRREEYAQQHGVACTKE